MLCFDLSFIDSQVKNLGLSTQELFAPVFAYSCVLLKNKEAYKLLTHAINFYLKNENEAVRSDATILSDSKLMLYLEVAMTKQDVNNLVSRRRACEPITVEELLTYLQTCIEGLIPLMEQTLHCHAKNQDNHTDNFANTGEKTAIAIKHLQRIVNFTSCSDIFQI